MLLDAARPATVSARSPHVAHPASDENVEPTAVIAAAAHGDLAAFGAPAARLAPTTDGAPRLTTVSSCAVAQRRVNIALLPNILDHVPPTDRPLIRLRREELNVRLERAIAAEEGGAAAHCIHELWMRGEMSITIEVAMERLWNCAAAGIPEWLPMRYVDWLPRAYEVALGFRGSARGRSNIYLVLLDYHDSRGSAYGVYVGMSSYSPADRFDQHKAGIRAAGSVLKRGLEVLTGPTLHLQRIKRADAERIEVDLAEALSSAGLTVKGGH